MDALETLATRRSVRAFQSRPLPRAVLEQAVAAARQAPTARNLQPWEFVVVEEPGRLRHLAALTDNGRFIASAPACVAVLCRETKYYLEDGVAAVVHLLLALHAQGAAACWVAGDKKPYAPEAAEYLGATKDMKLVALIPCGFPAGPAPAPAKRPLQDMLHWETFGTPR
ncbi:MAG: nitroreductase family protein [candidate division FCPU426 bacterium]